MLSKIRDEWRHFLPYVLAVVVVIILIGRRFIMADASPPVAMLDEPTEDFSVEEVEEDTFDEKADIVVEIKGAVARPGLYELEEGARLYDAIQRSGGFLEEADDRLLNLAERLEDEMSIYVPYEGEVEFEIATETPKSSSEEKEQKININRADANELMQIPNIGPKKAEAILEYRDRVGKFQDVRDLLEVSGIGEKTLQNIEPFITVK
ncbi:helix-hairpin-helix domain-containing protein [Savagea faecisuis]|uniref:Helix-hairpin-helix domain-containing protein n=1 Tax=Savagea faecisuis TaxID=1274803 RepID=A0ABW3GXT2_9BACL